MHALHIAFSQKLADKLHKRLVVVVYDPRSEFLPFFDQELPQVDPADAPGLLRVGLGDQTVHLARYSGSFFALRAAVEPLVSGDRPEPLILYLPGIAPLEHSILMELELGGDRYEPQLKRLARNVLRERFTDGQIDGLLQRESVGYTDIVALLHQNQQGQTVSILRTLFENAASEPLLARWLAHDDQDAAIAEKAAIPELFALIESRLGLNLPAGLTLADARRKTWRYVLVGEFRADLGGDPPAAISQLPAPTHQDQIVRLHTITAALRRDDADGYIAAADQVESELHLAAAPVDPAHLGKIDTFRFEERHLLTHAGHLIAIHQYGLALPIVADRRRSFWVDRDVNRQMQWEVCRLMAELGRAIEQLRPIFAQCGVKPTAWVNAYIQVQDHSGFQVDALHRRLETLIACMDEDPETEKALAVVRREHEEWLKRLADGFTQALIAAGWTVPGVLHQTRIYPERVQTRPGRTAYLLIDALRYEMGVDLARQLEGAQDLTVQPAIAALPSITPVGMAALLPGAAASFTVIAHKGRLAARIENSVLPDVNERLKLLKARRPDVVDLTLSKLLGLSGTKLEKALGTAALVVVRSQEIDFAGEGDFDLLARQMMDALIGNLSRAVKKLAKAGIEHFVITADHGHQFALRKDDAMKTDAPGGDTLELHRRCWIGQGGSAPPGTVRVSGAELGYDTPLDFIFPTGLGVFKTGGGLSYHHGGASLQELVIPVITLRIPPTAPRASAGPIVKLHGLPDRLTNRTFGVSIRFEPSLLAIEPIAVRVILLAAGQQVGQTGMAMGATLDRSRGVIHLHSGQEASLGMMLTDDACASLRIVAQDPETDAVLDQSGEIPVKLMI